MNANHDTYHGQWGKSPKIYEYGHDRRRPVMEGCHEDFRYILWEQQVVAQYLVDFTKQSTWQEAREYEDTTQRKEARPSAPVK